MDNSGRHPWAGPVIGWLVVIGGLCLAAGMLWAIRLAAGLLWLAAPALILGATVVLMIEWHNPVLDRWGRALCAAGIATYFMALLAVLAGGDVEGGIPVGAQVIWQPVSLAALIGAPAILIAGGALLLLRRTKVRVS